MKRQPDCQPFAISHGQCEGLWLAPKPLDVATKSVMLLLSLDEITTESIRCPKAKTHNLRITTY